MNGRHRDKVKQTPAEALEGLTDGARIMVGGFGLCGNAEALIRAVVASGARNLTLISNNAGNMGQGLAAWLKADIVRKIVCTYVGNNEDLHQAMAGGIIDVQIVPQGTFVERMRAAGAGIPAFYTRTGVNTVLQEGKESREFDGDTFLMEHGLRADFALVKARAADRYGNLIYNKTARNFAPIMCTAATTTIVQTASLVEAGEIDPEVVVTPGIFVDRVVQVTEPAEESVLVAAGRSYP